MRPLKGYRPTKTTGVLFTIVLSIVLMGSAPMFFGPGLTTPEPIGPFLNQAFPEELPSTDPYEVAFENITFDSPLNFTVVPNSNSIVIGQRDGKIFWFDNTPDTSTKNLLLDLSSEVGLVWDGGFLGLAIHPEFGTAGRNFFYIYYTTKDRDGNDFPDFPGALGCDIESDWGNYLILERFEVNPASLTFVAGSRVNLIKIRMYSTAHRGGGMTFGDDGFLYLSTGEQAAAWKSQDIANNLDGGVLRLDVDKDSSRSHAPIRTMPEDIGFDDEITGKEYWIPNDNPFLSPTGDIFEEYFSLGLRNPHRMSKDQETGIFYIGEIGSSLHEEINVLSKGKNYGWPEYEGFSPGDVDCTDMYNGMPHQEPLVAFPRSEANAIIGGYVYRGGSIPELYGKYICADYGNGEEIWSVDTQTGDYELLGNFAPANIISFGEDANGEIYILKLGDNVKLYKLVPSISSSVGIPELLSQTGAFTDMQTLEVTEGLIPYELIESFWSDAAIKKRWMAIPNDGTHDTEEERITYSENGDWDFPEGTVLVKHFDLPVDDTNPNITQKIETRFSIKGSDGDFYFLTYNWNETQTDATLQEVSLDEPITIATAGGARTQIWHYPSQGECLSCHNNANKGTLGARTRYLNSDYTYPKTNQTGNQLVTLSYLGILEQDITDNDTPNFLTYKASDDPNATLDEKARSYLDLNCAYCHRPGTGNRGDFDLRLINSLEETNLLMAGTNTPIGIEGERILVPGDAEKSILYHRMNSVDPTVMMPPLAKNVVDEQGVALIMDWINQLDDETNDPPVAMITADPTEGTAPLTVSFTGSHSTDDIAIDTYLWDFGDGNTSSQADPSHTFNDPGTYLVQLTVADQEGLEDTASVTLIAETANQPPVAVIIADPIEGDAPLNVSFIGSNSTDDIAIDTYLWDFGDGNTSSQADPSHTFNDPGSYLVELTVTDQHGLQDAASLVIISRTLLGAASADMAENPVQHNTARIKLINLPAGASVKNIQIFDSSGKMLIHNSAQAQPDSEGYLEVPIGISPSGVYYVVINLSEGRPLTMNMLIAN